MQHAMATAIQQLYSKADMQTFLTEHTNKLMENDFERAKKLGENAPHMYFSISASMVSRAFKLHRKDKAFSEPARIRWAEAIKMVRKEYPLPKMLRTATVRIPYLADRRVGEYLRIRT